MMRDRAGRELIVGMYWDYSSEEWTHREGARLSDQHAISAVPVDWDADGDFDLVLGTSSGRLVRWMNLGTRSEPAFAEDAEEVHVPDAPEAAKVADPSSQGEGEGSEESAQGPPGHAMPEIADWDQDGAWDLVVGTDDGAVRWARNVGRPGSPEFAAWQELLAPAQEDALERSGVDVQVEVADLNGDGRVDLIVGDNLDRNLTSEQMTAQLEAMRKQLGSEAPPILAVPENEDEQSRQIREAAEAAIVEGMLEGLMSQATSPHGRVWLYARAAARGD
jgi:hypothetical protein